jgi:hypothetical protein
MWWYLGIAAVCAALVPWARKRSEGSMVRYSIGTGAPLVIVLFSATALGSAVAQGAGDADLARELFTGGLIGGALVQFILMRRTYGIGLGQHPAKAVQEARAAAEAGDPDEPDDDRDPDPRRAVPTE